MAKHLSVLRQFHVSSDDGGMWIEHDYKDCDWTDTVDSYRLTGLMKQATAHARVCDGQPQPRPEPRPLTPFELRMRELWSPLIRAMQTSLVLPASRGLQATAFYQDELLIPADQALTIEVSDD